MKDHEKRKQWKERMPFFQATTTERALRDMKSDAGPSYKLVPGNKQVARRAGMASKVSRMVRNLLKRLE